MTNRPAKERDYNCPPYFVWGRWSWARFAERVTANIIAMALMWFLLWLRG